MTAATAPTTENASNKPTHIAYYTRKGREGEKDFWSPCGAAWAHKDGQGFRIRLDAMPTGGVIELRINEPRAANDTGASIEAP